MTDHQLWTILLSTLNKFPNLASQMPANWPSDPTYNITVSQMNHYEKNKNGHWVINLPLTLVNVAVNPMPQVNQLFTSILQKFDDFCSNFISTGTPNANKMISPIWTDNWSLKDSRFFAVTAEIYFTYFLMSKGYKVIEFEKPYNSLSPNGKSADILFQHNGLDVYVDIKSPKTLGFFFCKKSLRKKIEFNANRDMNGEFAQLPKNAIGMIAFLYRPLEHTGRQFYYGNSALDIVKHPTDNNKFAQVYWAKPVLTVTGRHYQVFRKISG